MYVDCYRRAPYKFPINKIHLSSGGNAESDSVYCDRCYRSVVCPSVRMSSVTLVHPAKAVGRNEMPFDRDTRVVPSNVVLDRGPGLQGKGRFGVSEPPVLSDAY